MMVLLALALAAAQTWPALAIVETSKETFGGYMRGGELLLVSDSDGGPSCRGRLSAGLLDCSDGRAGTFTLRRTYLGWLGRGTLDDEPLTITIG